METPTSTGTVTQPAPLKPWKQVAEESNIFSLPPEQRIAEYDKWSAENVAQGIKDGDFDSRGTFDQFKLFDIRTRKNLASDDIVGASDEEVFADYEAFKGAFASTQAAFSANKPTPQDEAIQGEVLQGKRKSAFLRGQMFFNPAVVNDPQKYREAILESDAPADIKMFYAGLRPEMEKSATVTRRRELANNVITRDVADKVVTAIQEGTELFGADIGTPQSPALKKNKDGIWSVVDPEYSDKETSFLGRANAKYNPLADSLYKPFAAINEYQQKYGLTDEQVQQDYMESLIENAPTSVNRWFGKATSIEEYVKQLDSTVRVKNKDVAPEVRVQDPNLFFDAEGYNAAVDKAKAPDEAKTFAKEARTQFADAVAGDIYNNLLNNRDDFREGYAKDVVDRKDMEKAITRYYKDKKDQAWYDDVGETIGQAGTALKQGGMDLMMMPSAIKGMFGDVEAAENYRYYTLAQKGEMQAEEAVANRTGGAGFIKLNNDVMRIIPDLVVQMVIAVATGGMLSGAQASLIAARTGISRAAATTALRQAAITGEKTALKSQLLRLIPEVTAKTVDDVAEEVLKASARTVSNNPFKGGIGTQRAVGSAYAGLSSASATFGQVYTDVRNMGKSPEESIATARTAGIVAGAITSGLTHSFGMLGRGGVEDFASMGRKAGEFTIKDIVNAGMLDSLKTPEGRQLIRNIAKGISKDALSEGAEEGLDQALNLISQYATNPSPEAQNRKATDIINESLYASLLGGIAGSGAASVGQARASAPGITAQQIQAEILGAQQPPVAGVPPVQPQQPPVQAPPVVPVAPVVPSANPAVQNAQAVANAAAAIPNTSQTAAALAAFANAAAFPMPEKNLPEIETPKPAPEPEVQPAEEPVAVQPEPATPEVAPANAEKTPIEPTPTPAKVEPEPTENMKTEEKPLTDDAAEAMRDIIQMKKSKGEKPNDAMVSKLAEYDAKKSGVTVEQGDIVSNIVVGHPMFEPPHPELKNLIPIKIRNKGDASGSVDRALKVKEKALKYIGGYQYNQSKAKTPAQKKQFAKDFNQQELNRQEEILGYLNNDVFPELKRIEEAAPEAKPEVARDTTKTEQMTPEKGDEVFVKGGDERITRRIDNIFTAEGKQMVLLQGLRDPMPLDEVTVDPKSDYRKRKQKKAEQKPQTVDASPQLIRQLGDFAVRDRQPINQEYINASGGVVPEGYVKQGELYVYQPEQKAEAVVEARVEPAKPAPQTQSSQKLPKELAGAKPRYGYANINTELSFASDFDKAAYIVAQEKKNRRHDDYMKWAVQSSGLTEEQVRAHGTIVRESIKASIKPYAQNKRPVPALFPVAATPVNPSAQAVKPTVKPAQRTPVQAVISKAITETLPLDLTKAKPRYAFKDKNFIVSFVSDFDKAAYIVSQPEDKQNKQHAKYLAWATSASGLTAEQVQAHGSYVRQSIKTIAQNAEGGTPSAPKSITIGKQYTKTKPAVESKPTQGTTPEKQPAQPSKKKILFRGFGRKEKGSVYSDRADGPVLGGGKYYAFNEEEASRYGPEVEQVEFDASNALVISSDKEWSDLTKKLGWRFPNPSGRSPETAKQEIKTLTNYLKAKGYTAIVVDGIKGSVGDNAKLLKNVFGTDQVFIPEGFPETPTQVKPEQKAAGQEGEVKAEAPAKGTSKPKGIQGSAFESSMPKGKERVTGQYVVIEAGDLVTSFDPGFPKELQPRDRTRAASKEQISEIAINLAPERLGDSPTVDVGAPNIDDNGAVLSGNGRVTAIRANYESGGVDYKNWITQNAERFGFNAADIAAMKNPVLVRRISDYGKLSKEEFAVQANQSQVLSMSKGEKAKADASILLANTDLFSKFRPSEDGNVLVSTNREFIAGFVQETGAMDLLAADGSWTPDLGVRIQNAVLATMLDGDAVIIQNLIEDPSGYGLKKVSSALLLNAPNLIKLFGTDWSINQPLAQAIKDFISVKNAGQKVEEFLDQSMLFADPERTAVSDILLTKLFNAKSQKELNDFLSSYVARAENSVEDQRSGGLFGGQPRTVQQIVTDLTSNEKQPAEQQQDLSFGKPQAVPAKQTNTKGQKAKTATSTPEVKAEAPDKQGDVVAFIKQENDKQKKSQASAARSKRITPGEARKKGIAIQIDRLGITSKDPASVIAALEKIAAKPSEKHHGRIAKDLLSVLEGSGVQIQLVSGNDARMAKYDSRVNGWYDPATNTAYINLDGPHELGIEETILHELVHASGEKVIQNPQTEAQKRILADLEKQMLAARKNAIALGKAKMGVDVSDLKILIDMAAAQNDYGLFDILYGVSSLSEYHAHATTSRSFQKFLATYKEGGKRSLMERFINSITSLLSGKKTADGSDAEKAYATLLDLMREGKGDVRLSNADVVQSRARGASTEQDAEYLELAKDEEKNAEALQAIVDAAAKAAGGQLVFHGGDIEGDVIDVNRRERGAESERRAGTFYASSNPDAAKTYPGKQQRLFFFLRNPFRIGTPEMRPASWTGDTAVRAGGKVISKKTSLSIGEAVDRAKQFGYDGVIYDNIVDTGRLPSQSGKPPIGSTYVAFNSEQIKSADPVTRDDAGNVIPLSQRFQPTSPDIRFSRARGTASDEDARHAALEARAKDGDAEATAEAQAIVNEAADDAAYKRSGYHGTRASWTVWDSDIAGGLINIGESKEVAERYATGAGGGRQPLNITEVEYYDGRKFTQQSYTEWTSGSESLSTEQIQKDVDDGDAVPTIPGASVKSLRFKADKILDLTTPEGIKVLAGLNYTTRLGQGVVSDAKAGKFYWDRTKNEYALKTWKNELIPQLKELGYDSVRFKDDTHNTIAVFSPEQIKSADPFTYDEAGNLIPLSQRFQPESPDIRFSRARSIVSDTVTKFAPEFNVVDDKDGPAVFFDGRNVTVNPDALENLDEYEVKDLSERAVVAAKAAPKDPIAASIIQQTDGYSAYNFDSATRKEIRKSLAKAHAVATENGMAPLAMDLGAKLFEYGGATDADVRKSMARGIPSDEEYLATVEAGDMEKAQQMVNDFIGEPNSGMTRLWRSDAAKVGTPVPNWMESTEELQGIKDASGRWFYKTKEEAERHMADFEGESLSFVDVPSESVESFNAKDNPFAGGYGKQGFEYFVPRQIAEARVSTAPVVRDDAGNVIPLSERFPGAAMPQSRARGVDLVAYVPRNRSGPRLAVEKLFAGFRSRGMVTEDAYNAFRDFEAFKKETESFIAFIAKDFTNVTNKLFGDGADNWLNYRVFSRDANGNVTVSKTGFKTAKDADNFAATNRYKDYIVSTGEELMNKALGSNGPTLREDVRDRIDQLTKKGLDDIAKSIEAYKDEYLNYWNLVMMQPQPGMIDPDQIATLRERKEQWMKALQLRAAEQRQLVDDARKEAVRVALEDGANHIIAQQKFAKTYLPDELVYQIEQTRDKIDEFSTRLTKIGWLMEGSELQMVIDGRMGVYVTRSYEAFETQDRANYVAFLDEAYRALYNPEQEYNKLAMERIMPMVRHIKAGITERRIQDLKRENEQRQLDEIMADLMADPRQVTQVDRIPGQPIEGTEYEQLLRAVARRELLLRRLKEKEDFIAKAVTSLGKSTFASNIGNARNRMRAIKKEAKRLYRERFAEQVEVANIMGAPNALRWTLMTEDEAHDIANVERSLSESPGNIAGSKIWTASISGRKHSTFHSAVSDDFRSNLDTITNSTASQTGFKGTGAGDWRSINDKILEYKENVPAFRRLFLGEINNPLMRVSETLTKQASLIAAGELYQNLADIGMKQGWLVEKELADTDTTKYAGWTSILTSSDNDQGYKDNPLKDLVADPVMVEAIRKLLSTNQPSNSAFKAISFTVGLVLFNLTAGSFKSIQRNLSSFIPFLLNTGLIGAMINPRRWSVVTSNFVLASKMVEQSMASSAGVSSGKDISNPILKRLDKGVRIFLSGIAALRLSGLAVKGVSTSAGFVFRTKQKPTNEQFQETYQRAVGLGVANDNVDKEAMSKMLNLEETLNRKPKDKKLGKLGKVLMLNEASEFGSYAFSLAKSTLKERSQLYGAPDDFTKIFAWLNEMDAQARIHAKDTAEYEKWRGKDGLFSDMPPEHVELAAEYTTDLVQSHSKVWAHITQFKKAGFGVLAAAFIAAKAEFYRNAFNSYRIAVKEMRSKNERERNAGIARFASALTAHFVYGNAIGYGLKMILKAFADDDEVVEDSIEIRNAISALGPEYAKNKNATYVVYKNGTFDWVDLSFSTPFAFVWETINAGKRGVSEAQVEDNIVWEMTKEIVGENLGNFASPQIALDAFAVMRTGFDPIRGVKIWDSQTDNMGEKLMKSMGYFLKKVGSPGDVKSVSNIVNAARGIEENGRQYKLGTEVGSVFLGTSVRTFKIADIVEQKLAQGTNSLNNRITPLYNSVLTESNDVSMDDCESDTTEYYKTDVEVMTKMQKIWAAGNTLLADTPGGKKMLSAVIGGDKVKMESNRERALTTGKRHRVTLSDSMDRKVKGLGDKYDDPRHKVVKDTLKKLNEKP